MQELRRFKLTNLWSRKHNSDRSLSHTCKSMENSLFRGKMRPFRGSLEPPGSLTSLKTLLQLVARGARTDQNTNRPRCFSCPVSWRLSPGHAGCKHAPSSLRRHSINRASEKRGATGGAPGWATRSRLVCVCVCARGIQFTAQFIKWAGGLWRDAALKRVLFSTRGRLIISCP